MTTPAENEKQLGIVLVTHTEYGAWLLKAAEMILGTQPGCMAVRGRTGTGRE